MLKQAHGYVILLLLIIFPTQLFGLGQFDEQRENQKRMAEEKKLNREIKTEKYYDSNIGKYVDVAAGEILVKFRSVTSVQTIKNINTSNRAKVVRTLPGQISQLSANNTFINTKELLDGYKNNPEVEIAEPNYIVHQMTTTPNDTYYPLQWAFPQIKADRGWDINKGASEVIVAVIDSGYDIFQDEIWNKLWWNSTENSGSNWHNGIDDDGNGYIDDYLGWDFYYIDNSPIDSGNGHGSHVSGIIAAETNENHGVAGVSWYSKIMPLRVFNNSGFSFSSDIISAIYYAANNGANIINMSLGGSSYSALQNSAIQYAHNKGCVIVASAGNDGDSTISYPASYDNVISVASVDKNDTRSSFSNHNAYVDVCAPGGDGGASDSGDIYSDYLAGNWTYMAGTSMSAPFVSGLAALIFSQYPTYTNTQVENKIFQSADDLGTAGRDDFYGYGRINALKALSSAITYSSGINMISIPFYPSTGESAAATLGVGSSLKLVGWDPIASESIKYKSYPDSCVSSLVPGKGYFVKLDSSVILNSGSGTTVSTASDFTINLKPYWNQIGNPFISNINWSDIQVRNSSGKVLSMSTAISRGLIYGPWDYSISDYHSISVLEPWKGYWVKANEDLDLIVPHP